MAASKSVSDEQKFMDVARPGKGKVVGTSRPVAGPIVSDSKASNIEVVSDEKEEKVNLSAPSESRKVIQPLAASDIDEAASESVDQPQSDSPVIESVDVKPKNAPETQDDPEVTEEISKSSETPEDPKDDSVNDTNDSMSEAAGVDALAAKAETKKQAAKRAEEEQKQDEHLQNLTDSKEYFVPIGHNTSNSRKKSLIIVFIILIIVFGAGVYYVMTTMAKDDNKQNNLSQSNTGRDSNSQSNGTTGEDVQPTADVTDENQTTAVASRDAERKDELKNLQNKLEAYFNDNDMYPASSTWVEELALTESEVTGPSEDAYIYTASADNQTFTLSAQLENTSDTDAEQSGMYIIRSVNSN